MITSNRFSDHRVHRVYPGRSLLLSIGFWSSSVMDEADKDTTGKPVGADPPAAAGANVANVDADDDVDKDENKSAGGSGKWAVVLAKGAAAGRVTN